MPGIKKISIKTIVGFVLLVIFTVLFVRIVNWKIVWTVLGSMKALPLIECVLLMIFSFGVGIFRYKLIIGASIPLKEVAYVYFLSKTGGSLTPARLGDFAPFLLKEYRVKEIGLAIIVDKMVEFYMQLLFGVIGLLVLQNLSLTGILFSCSVFTGISGAFFLLGNNAFWRAVLQRILDGLEHECHGTFFSLRKAFCTLLSFAEKVSYEVKKLGKRYFVIMALSIISYIFLVVLTRILLEESSAHISIFLLFEMITLSGVIMVLSFVPLGLGITEVTLLYLLHHYGVTKEAFAAFAVSSRSLTLLTLFGCYLVMVGIMHFIVKPSKMKIQ
ncbi:MAG TPA: lysylphosphatidylglycerol synthase transmembrane domain-containing protein [Chitinivibrionales bacterium]|nr:lysylphosphatidylglycerol synthase transmembrane domain-containing protein [Chitinivibrionales bacterium]